VSDYLDTEDFEGPLQKIFADALGFIMRNLHKVQAGRGVNAPGLPEIPESVFEELLVNALVHRDYLVNAPIRLFIFDNRIEIISPGHLPNNLTVEKIRSGNSNIHNPILVSYVAKGLLPYHGLGSGIKRALEQWPQIEFADDHDACLFRVTVTRNPVEDLDLLEADAPRNAKDAAETAGLKGHPDNLSGQNSPIADLLNKIQESPNADYAILARDLRLSEATVKRNIQKLKQQNRLRRVGSKKTGHWEIIE
jgi:ATP-dependent DNA helicase RecG